MGLTACDARVVMLSRVGVDRKDELLFKFNPFLKIGKW